MHNSHSPRVEAILESARRQFARYGFSKCTMEDIAADTGRGKASLYYYFPTKEAIFREILAREQADFKHLAQSTFDGHGTAAEKIRAYVEQRLGYFHQLTNLGKLGVQSFSGIRPIVADILDEFSRWELDALRAIIQTGKHCGEFSLDDPESTVSTLLHALHGLRLRALTAVGDTQLDPDTYHMLLRETRILVDLILRGILVRDQKDVHPSHPLHVR
jgi:TetR/AcrR family transcriptional regulator